MAQSIRKLQTEVDTENGRKQKTGPSPGDLRASILDLPKTGVPTTPVHKLPIKMHGYGLLLTVLAFLSVATHNHLTTRRRSLTAHSRATTIPFVISMPK